MENNKTHEDVNPSDIGLQTEINKELVKKEGADILNRVELAVNNGRVVAIGYMENESQCKEVVSLIEKVDGVRKVFNNVKVGKKPECKTTDTIITGKVKAYLFTPLNGIRGRNFSVTTVDGKVYIVGEAESKVEERKVLDFANSVQGVKEVCSYINSSE